MSKKTFRGRVVLEGQGHRHRDGVPAGVQHERLVS